MTHPAPEALIRQATPTDIPAMVTLLAQLFSIEKDFCADPGKQAQGLALLLESGSAMAWVAEHQGTVVGMVTLQALISTAEGGAVGLIEDLVVASDWRGRGLGGKLIGTAETWAVAHGLTRLQLLADRGNAAALAFYEQRGWEPTQLVALRKLPR